MINALNELYRSTNQILKEFCEDNKLDRDELIKKFEKFVSRREELLKVINGPYSEEENRIGKELVLLERKLQQKVNKYSDKLQEELTNLNKKRTSNKKYLHPYQNLISNDGSFIDKKK